jgi:serine/threonine protein kinase
LLTLLYFLLLRKPSYVAPEILKNAPYDQSCDMWSVGVILYVMLCGYLPFAEETQERMFERVKQGDWGFDLEDWSDISKDAKDLISSMLVTNPDARISAASALRSTWINEEAKTLSSRDLSQSLINIKKRPRLKDVARAFMALSFFGTKTALNPIRSENNSLEHSSHELS